MRTKLRYGGFSLLITVLFLVAAVLVNVFAGMLTDRFDLKADLTETGVYSLSEKAETVLEGIGEPIDFIVLSEESYWLSDTRLTRIVDILQRYSVVSGGNIRVQYVDPTLGTFNGPDYGNSLAVLKENYAELENIQSNDIIIMSGRRATSVAVSDLYTWEYDSNYNPVVTAIQADQQLISALNYVLSESTARAVFLEGHDEASAQLLQVLFERCGYICQTVNLAMDEIPDDAVVVVSVAPSKDFLEAEIVKLESYLLTGGNTMFFYGYETKSTPRLDALLSQWGLTVESKLICDEVNSIASQYNFIVTLPESGGLPSLADAAALEAPIGMINARSIISDWAGRSRSGFIQYPIIRTASSSSYAKDYGSGAPTMYARESGDESGPFMLGYCVRMLTRNKSGDQVYASMIVSNAGMVDDSFLYNFGTYFYNLDLLAGMAGDLNPFGDIVYIPSKPLAGEMMTVTAGQANAILIGLVVVMPLAIITAGIAMWRKRRRL